MCGMLRNQIRLLARPPGRLIRNSEANAIHDSQSTGGVQISYRRLERFARISEVFGANCDMVDKKIDSAKQGGFDGKAISSWQPKTTCCL